MHTNQEVISEFECNDTELQLITKGMTSFLQSLDVIINKPFKDYIKKKYIEYCYEKNSLVKVNRDLIINWVSEVWWDNNLITPYMIKNSFKITELTKKLDGSENELFTRFKRIKEEIIIGNDINEKNEVID